MPITMFIQDRSGNYNFECEFPDRPTAIRALNEIKNAEGYWVDEKHSIFIPWHRVDFVRIEGKTGTEI